MCPSPRPTSPPSISLDPLAAVAGDWPPLLLVSMVFSFSSPAPQNPFQMPMQALSRSPSPFQFNFQQPQKQQLMLYTTDGKPVGYNTKWEELHPESQKALLQIEDKIREYKDESERLDQCGCLHDLNFECQF